MINHHLKWWLLTYIFNTDQYGYKIVPFEQYNGEYLVVSTEKYYNEIKQQLNDKELVEYKDFCSMTMLKKNICKLLREELKREIKNDEEIGNFCFL